MGSIKLINPKFGWISLDFHPLKPCSLNEFKPKHFLLNPEPDLRFSSAVFVNFELNFQFGSRCCLDGSHLNPSSELNFAVGKSDHDFKNI